MMTCVDNQTDIMFFNQQGNIPTGTHDILTINHHALFVVIIINEAYHAIIS